jgi:O-antigen ligase
VRRLLDRTGMAAVLLCPLFLLHGRGIADALISLVALLFLLRSALAREWGWLRARWVPVAGLWWLWMVACSAPGWGEGGPGSFVQSLVVVRFLLFAAALETWVLAGRDIRRWLLWLISAAGLYIAIHSIVQFATGFNLYGAPRGPDGEITGPYAKPRAGPIYSRLLFPAMLPAAAGLFGRAGIWPKLVAQGLTLAEVAIGLLMGERMPALLIGLGLVVSAIFLRPLRPVLATACVVAVLIVAATPVISPQAYHRLVEKFSEQMAHFPTSDYGRIAARAVVIAEQNPWTGRGFDGFRTGCADPRTFHGWAATDPDGGGATICVQHPHNHYLQAATDTGFPGLVLFCAMVLTWLLTLGRGLWRNPDPLRVGLFAAVLMQEWPIASSSDFVNMPLGGWFFLLLGFGLAEARAAVPAPAPAPYMSTNPRPVLE